MLLLALAANVCDAQEAVTLEKVDATAKSAALAGHNAWVLTSAALVLFMTAPGLAMFYSGLVRKKNVLGVMMQCIFLMGLMTVIWGLYGYSLSFGGDPKSSESVMLSLIGNGEYLLMANVERAWDTASEAVKTPMEDKIPRLSHMLFQGMFFIITPALICGAFAERMKFSTMVVFSILWATVVYCPLCHWVWDQGILAYGSPRAIAGGSLDFAGGAVVHISSGVSALVCSLVMGRRLGFGSEAMRPHNLTYTTLGAAMLWVGWFGFNAGSQLGSDGVTASAFATTHFSAAAGTLAWAGLEWFLRGKPSVLGACSGAVAGLVCITPAAGYVNPGPAMVMGLLAGGACFFACTKLKSIFKYDDTLDAFGVHGVGGIVGALLTGVFAAPSLGGTGVYDYVANAVNPDYSIGGQVWIQLQAVITTIVWSGVVSLIAYKLVDIVIGLRVTEEEEREGLDISSHGESAYNR